jgi:hypothetical protein
MRWGLWLALAFACGCGRMRFDAVPLLGDGAPPGDGAGPDGLMAITLGDTTVETGIDQHTSGNAECSSFYATQTGVVDRLYIYHPGYPGDNATAYIAGLYTDDGTGDHPVTLLGGGMVAPGAVLANFTWYVVPISEATIVAGNFYWIAAACPVGAGNMCSISYKYYGATGGGPCTATPTEQCTQHSQESTLTTMPATWTKGTTYLQSINSYYAAHS